MSELDRTAIAFLMALFHLENLKRKGFLTGPTLLSGEGYAKAKAIEAAGFSFEEGELEPMLAYIQSGAMAKALEEHQA